MSLFKPMTLECPGCGAAIEFDAVESVNADRRPDLRAAILDGSFQRETCTECGKDIRLEPELVYFGIADGLWILVRPAADLPSWAEFERTAAAIFDAAYGPKTPRAAREIGQAIKVRVTFGWPGLQEKLLCAEAGIDDRIVELTKIAIMRTQNKLPLSDKTECRLIGYSDAHLAFAWLDPATEAAGETIEAPRVLYETIAADTEAWHEVLKQLTAGPMVDLNRILVPAAAEVSL